MTPEYINAAPSGGAGRVVRPDLFAVSITATAQLAAPCPRSPLMGSRYTRRIRHDISGSKNKTHLTDASFSFLFEDVPKRYAIRSGLLTLSVARTRHERRLSHLEIKSLKALTQRDFVGGRVCARSGRADLHSPMI
ncbi:hypothetical protein EVAR_36859_1 [Eumeta japonica]|uniref:Uncharacterized protein n=1 Tax=Eumeta variegata TaxID=151549 RepID=A0A4C1WR48_EUMVA|nr:hypothetical protein EVAR_36859_1 [Eumeta japonica]